jgi:hypothetical protein
MNARQAAWSQRLWPSIQNVDTARAVALNSSYFVFSISGLTAAMALLVDRWSLVDAAAFGILGFLLRRMSRVAATSALVLFLFERGYEAYVKGWQTTIRGSIFTTFIILGLAAGVRGTIAFHRYKRRSGAPKP